jgi:hypothetical protein
VIRLIAVGLIGTIATVAGMALYERDALRPVLEALGIVGVPVLLGIVIHPLVGVTAGLIVLEGLYEARQAGILEEREQQLRTFSHRLRADLRRGSERIQDRVEKWFADLRTSESTTDKERESL